MPFFSYKPQFQSDFTESLATLLAKILNEDIKEDPTTAQIICKKCYKLAKELDDLQNRVSKIKHEIIDNHRGVSTKQECEEDKPTPKPTEQSNKENQIPKKLLFIPESDDESSQVSLSLLI